MPFGLTNVPATFTHLMQEMFREQLDKFVLVFFDDILVYSKNVTNHKIHVQNILEILRKHKFFSRKSKCTFFTN